MILYAVEVEGVFYHSLCAYDGCLPSFGHCANDSSLRRTTVLAQPLVT